VACKSVLVVEDDLDIRESLEQILEIEGYQPLLIATIPVIVVSAAGERAKSTTANGYIKKPIELDSLLEVVHQYCDSTPTKDEPST